MREEIITQEEEWYGYDSNGNLIWNKKIPTYTAML